VCNLVQTNDTTKFFRERVLQIGLRILQAEIYLLKNIIRLSTESTKIASIIDTLKGRFEYKQDLTGILVRKIRHYEMVNPLEYATFQAIHKLECNFFVSDDDIFEVDSFMAKFTKNFTAALQEMRDEPILLIKEELRLNRLDIDGVLS